MTTISEHSTSNTNEDSYDKAVEEILQHLPTEVETVLELPSRSKFYNLIDPAHPLTVRPMTFEDEKHLAVTKNKDQIVNVLIDRCVGNVQINDLLLFDKLYILLKIREVSFGTEYKVENICGECGFHNEITFNISDFKVTTIPEDLEDPREIELPGIKQTAKVRFPRVLDEKYLKKTSELMDQIYRFVLEIGGHSNKTVIHKVIQKLPSKDIHLLVKNIFGTEYGMNTKATYACDNCENVNIADLSITQDFFSAS